MDIIRKITLFCFIPLTLSHAIDLDDAVRLSRKNDPDFTNKTLKFRANEYAEQIAKGDLLPSVSLSLEGSHSSTAEDDIQTYSSSSKLGLSSQWVIIDPPKIINARIGVIDSETAKTEKRKFDSQHLVSISKSYFNALTTAASYRASLSALRQYQRSYDATEEMVKEGLKSEVDSLISLSALESSKVAVLESQNKLDQAINTLRTKIDTPIVTLNDIEPRTIPSLPEVTELDFQEMLTYALKYSTRIKTAQLSLSKSRLELDSASASFMPKVSFSVDAHQRLGDDLWKESNKSVKATLKAEISLFSGLKDLHSVRQAELKYHANEFNLTNEQYNIELDLKKAYQNHINAKLKAHASLSALKSSLASQEASQEANQAGTNTELEVLTAITRTMNARKSFYEASYAALQSYLELYQKSGLLTNNQLKHVNQNLLIERSLSTKASLLEPNGA